MARKVIPGGCGDEAEVALLNSTRVVMHRGGLVESVHHVRAAIVRDERTFLSSGDVATPILLRSAAKPFQALACVVTGAAKRFGMTDAELALACGSHSGEREHEEVAIGLLERIGLSRDALRCGAHPPIHAGATHALARDGREPEPLHNNCSGKHAAMLAACVARGWDTDGYLEPDHPLQQLNRRHMALFSGVEAEEIVLGIDGCSVPTFGIPLEATARAFARYMNRTHVEHLPDDVRAAIGSILAALEKHPEMIGGTGRVDTDLLRTTAGRIVSKVGAEGLWGVGVAGESLGMAVKCDDGAARGRFHAGLALLRRLDLLSDAEWEGLAPHHDPIRRNHRRIDVGRVEVQLPGAR